MSEQVAAPEIPEELRAWRQRWSHPPTLIPASATGLWYSEEYVDQMLADYSKQLIAALTLERATLKAELESVKHGSGWWEVTPAGQKKRCSVNEEEELRIACEEVAALKAEQNKFLELVCKYQCNPTWKLSTYEAIRNHLETAHRVCNENYDWAKRVEAERDTLKQQLADSDLALDFANKCVGKYMADAEELKAKVERLSAPVSGDVATLLCNLAQILDVVKIEWAESWSEWDQQQRDAITAFLTAYYARASTPPTLLVFTCPFDGEVWRFHTQEQLDMLRKHLEWHATNINSKEYPA